MSKVPVVFQAAVEGDLDEVVLRRIAEHIGAKIGFVYGQAGKAQLRANIHGYNSAARHFPWVVVVDLDDEHECGAALRKEWLPDEAPLMCFRVAVRQLEAWLLADAKSMSRFLGVSQALVAKNPDALPNAKEALIRLAERSNKRMIRESIPPVEGSKRTVGVLYNPTLGRYVSQYWDPEVAAGRSESLRRCIKAIDDLQARART